MKPRRINLVWTTVTVVAVASLLAWGMSRWAFSPEPSPLISPQPSPPAGTVVDGVYTGPLFDAMAQWNSNSALDDLATMFRNSQVKKVALIPCRNDTKISRAASWRIDRRLAEEVRTRYPDLFVLGSPKFFEYTIVKLLDFSNRSDAQESMRQNHYSFVGEILFRHADKRFGINTPRGETSIDLMGAEPRAFIESVQTYDIPIMIHWEMYRFDEDYPIFARLCAAFPRQRFIIPHMGFGYPEQIGQVLDNHPNVFTTISKRDVRFKYFRNPSIAASQGPPLMDKKQQSLLPIWHDFLVRHQDRVLFATDVHKDYMYNAYPRLIRRGRMILGQLPPEVAEKIAWRNAEKLYRVPLVDPAPPSGGAPSASPR